VRTTTNDTSVFISVAEPSADEHAAQLIHAVGRDDPAAVFCGLAGPQMRAAGCECFQDLTIRSAMALAAFSRVPSAAWLLWRLRAFLDQRGFHAAVMVDSPALNLPIARMCRRRGIPVLYYIAPQTWAWGPRAWRNARIRKRVDHLACIWPFEESFFRRDGIPATYVGHPSFDRLLATTVDDAMVAGLRAGGSPVIAILPGSRAHVVEEVLPGQLAVASAIASRFRRSRFVAVAAGPRIRSLIEAIAHQRASRLSLELLEGEADRAAALKAADLALVASGTITLEVAFHNTPMIVMYNTNRWTYNLVGRWLITTPHLSIPNILAGRRIVPEFMPYYCSVDPIIAQAVEWLATPGALERVRRDLRAAVQPIVRPGAARNAAAILRAMIDERRGGLSSRIATERDPA